MSVHNPNQVLTNYQLRAKEITVENLLLEKGLPQHEESERVILGAILLAEIGNEETVAIFNGVIETVAAMLKPKDFFHFQNQIIYSAMISLWEKGIPIHFVPLSDELRRRGSFEQIGGATYVAGLIDGVPRNDPEGLTWYINRVRYKAILREVITAAFDIAKEAIECPNDDEMQVVSNAEDRVIDIANGIETKDAVPLSEALLATINKIELMSNSTTHINGVPSGYGDLDAMTGGFQRQDFVIIAARPSMGKTAIALNMACNAAKEGNVVAIFSLEMSMEQLVIRLIASEAKVDAFRLRTGFLNKDEWARIAAAFQRMAEWKVFIDDTPAMSVMEMRRKSRRIKTRYGLDLVILDYIQLMTGRKAESRQQEVSNISRDIKVAAKQLDTPIIGLSQLSRSIEQRADDKPKLSDLRESGSLEQDADTVIFIDRPEVHNPTNENRGYAELICGKQRNGSTGSVPLAFLKEFTRFENMWHGK